MREYPEHEKLKKIENKSQAIGEFLDWLFNERHRKIAYWRKRGILDDVLEPDFKMIQEWLAEYFNIDETKLENEKRGMLEEMREANKR